MALLIDIGQLSPRQTDDCLEEIYKATHNHGDDDAVWNPHESPYIRRLIELFTQRGLMRLDGFRSELEKWLAGEMHRPGTAPDRPAGAMRRWSPGELKLVKLYLELLPPERWSMDDHMMMVDYLVQRYLPEDDLRTESEWLSTRATLMGRVQSNMEDLSLKQADAVLAALPSTVPEAIDRFPMTRAQRSVLDFARIRSGEHITRLSDDARHRIRGVIAQHVENQQLQLPPAPGHDLQTKLLDQFAALNRDWRRIAVTEAGEAHNQGYVSSMKPGTHLKRLEQYQGACPFCRKIDGVVVEVVSPDAADKDPDSQIWPGKTNVGRSAAPRKRVGDMLVQREPDEMWWIAAGVQHPHCRGRWLPTIEDREGDDKEFGDWLRATLAPK